jgi:hypothetical protein
MQSIQQVGKFLPILLNKYKTSLCQIIVINNTIILFKVLKDFSINKSKDMLVNIALANSSKAQEPILSSLYSQYYYLKLRQKEEK